MKKYMNHIHGTMGGDYIETNKLTWSGTNTGILELFIKEPGTLGIWDLIIYVFSTCIICN